MLALPPLHFLRRCLGSLIANADYARLLDLESAVQLVLLFNTADNLGVHWCILTYDDCHYVANQSGIMKHVDSLLCHPSPGNLTDPTLMPALIGFFDERGTFAPTVLSDQDAKGVLRLLESFRTELRCNPGVNLVSKHGRVGKVQVIDLAVSASQLLLPTLNGLLLAYPVVYVVEGGIDGASRASRSLSSQDLTLFEMAAAPPVALCAALARHGWASQGHSSCSSSNAARKKKKSQGAGCGQVDRPTNVICSFTMPSSMCSQGSKVALGENVKAWAQRVEHALEVSALGWSFVKCVPSAVGTCSVSL
ncbi:hypothetical protein DUNSADRAFT_16558 [Dunaliella salina]|uniref:Uncharacterized protein n=1 Tax=Dunaliella salina TaxID=3046 RepID=A0ABQ7H0V5_DUNSA|nr:hypothetical protein DUNSADRAFT_16558 [Dunaliella salina]|eukprot:KAF5840467.1 hypothetical protein DUNSADRAFT_16558 [Dunaliella salina]